MHSSIFDALPGQDTPVGAISKNLARLWAAADSTPGAPAKDAKATQVNFILHLGLHTEATDALAQFQTAVRFSRRYPCRVVVLCPVRDAADDDGVIRAKIYGECHPGKTRGDLRCCEFVILSYPGSARRFLENQVSICLSTDLPVYYWAHNFTSASKVAAYPYLLGRAKRVLLDGSRAQDLHLEGFAWPRPEAVRDLAEARLLPVRQTIGQFLAGFPPAAILDGLRGATIRHGGARRSEAVVLANWTRSRLMACGAPASLEVTHESAPQAHADSLEVCFHYTNVQTFRFEGDFHHGCAHLSAHFRGEALELSTAIALLSPEAALAEAMFF